MTQMRKRRVVVRQLSALEALGGVTNICSDKTGTLTQGQMITRKAWIPSLGIYSVSGTDDAMDPSRGSVSFGPAPSSKQEAEKKLQQSREALDQQRSAAVLRFDVPGESRNITEEEDEMTEKNTELPEVKPEFEAFLHSVALCNLASVRKDSDTGKWKTMGDPTEVALQVFAHRFQYGKKTLETEHGWKQVAEYPFDSSVKRMAVVYEKPGEADAFVFVKGAVERILELCTNVGVGDVEQRLTDERRSDVLEQMNILADQGLRVLGVARKTLPTNSDFSDTARESVEKDLTLVGLAGLYDPPRLETKQAIKGKSLIFVSTIQIVPLTHLQTVHKPESGFICSLVTILLLPLQSRKRLVSSHETHRPSSLVV